MDLHGRAATGRSSRAAIAHTGHPQLRGHRRPVRIALRVLPRAGVVGRRDRAGLRSREVPERGRDDGVALPCLRARAAVRPTPAVVRRGDRGRSDPVARAHRRLDARVARVLLVDARDLSGRTRTAAPDPVRRIVAGRSRRPHRSVRPRPASGARARRRGRGCDLRGDVTASPCGDPNLDAGRALPRGGPAGRGRDRSRRGPDPPLLRVVRRDALLAPRCSPTACGRSARLPSGSASCRSSSRSPGSSAATRRPARIARCSRCSPRRPSGFGLYTAVKASFISSTFAIRVEERNLIYLSPIVFVAAVRCVAGRRVRPLPLAPRRRRRRLAPVVDALPRVRAPLLGRVRALDPAVAEPELVLDDLRPALAAVRDPGAVASSSRSRFATPPARRVRSRSQQGWSDWPSSPGT